jgi:hypothetical protein
VRRGRNHPHDARLIARYFEPSTKDEPLERHISTCASCAARQREIAAVLDDQHPLWRDDGASLLAEASLEAQRRKVLDRLAPGVRPRARVIAFPRSSAPARSSRPPSLVRSRLAAVAAIVALVGAAGAGWVIESQRHDGLSLSGESRRPAGSTLPSTQIGHEALLSDIEMALASPQAPALRALDALTPRAAETPAGR